MNARHAVDVVPMQRIVLDDLGWDHASVKGPEPMELEVSDEELRQVADRLLALAATCVAEDPAYFSEDPELLEPANRELFVARPEVLRAYLEDSFWSHDAIRALLDVGRGGRAQDPSWRVQSSGDVRREGSVTLVTLGVSPLRA